MIFSKRISLAGWISAVGAILLGDLSGAPCEALGQSEVQKLLPVEPVRFGLAAAISGDWAVVGATGGNDAGQPITLAYVFRRDNNGTPLDPSDDVWVEDTVLTAPGPVWNFITASVSVNGDRVLMGVSRDDGPVNDSGAAYVFRRNDNSTPTDPTDDTWVLEAKLTASDAAADDVFGSSVSIDRDRALVGAWGNDDAGDRSGSAYVFRRSDNGTPSDLSDDTWVQEGKLTTSDAAAYDHFGWSVSLSDDRGLIGGLSGASAYVFRRSDNGTPLDPSDDVWVEEAKLTPSESIPYDGFGFSVSLSGNRALVGAYGLDDGSDFPGAAYVFRHSDNGTPLDLSDDIWVEEAKLTASDGAARDKFGASVSLSGDRAIVGAPLDDDAANLSGSAYMFENIAGSWTQVAKLTASDGAEGDLFGFEVAASGDTALIGAHRSGETGAAYVFALGPPDAIPTVSGWGIVVMTLLLLTVGTIVMGRRVGVPS